MYDRYEQLAFDSQISAAILGNCTAHEFVLVELPTTEPIPESFHALGFSFIGITGIVDGVPRTAFAVELDDASLAAIANAWVQHLARIITAKLPTYTPDDSAQFLRRLYALEDSRDGQLPYE